MFAVGSSEKACWDAVSHRARQQLPFWSHGDVSGYVQSLACLVRDHVAPCNNTRDRKRAKASAFAACVVQHNPILANVHALHGQEF